MFCPKCGTNLPDGTKFCTNCGANLDDTASNAPQPVTTNNQPVQNIYQQTTNGPNGWNNGPNKQEDLKFWQKSWVMWVCLLFLTPVGIILCYINRERHSHWKIICGVFAAFFIIAMLMPDNDKNTDTNKPDTVAQEQSASSTSNTSNANKDTKSEKKKETAKQEKPKIEYTEVSVAVLDRELENNAAAAQKKYKGKYLKIVGRLGTIDSDGDYISVLDPDNEWAITGVHCSVKKKDKAQENYVLNLRKNQTVVAYGKITDVGELMGYSMDVDKFE